MSEVTPAQTDEFHAAKGLAMGEGTSEDPHCTTCFSIPEDDDELVVHEGLLTCIPCVVALTGDDGHDPDRLKDL